MTRSVAALCVAAALTALVVGCGGGGGGGVSVYAGLYAGSATATLDGVAYTSPDLDTWRVRIANSGAISSPLAPSLRGSADFETGVVSATGVWRYDATHSTIVTITGTIGLVDGIPKASGTLASADGRIVGVWEVAKVGA
jgi:hypothetical protein